MKNNNQNLNCYEFYVDGMHCAACEILIEKKLSKKSGVNRIKASLNAKKVIIEGQFEDEKDLEKLASEFTQLVQKEGYKVLVNNPGKQKAKWEDFIYAIPIGVGTIMLFIILQKLGIVNLVNTSGGSLVYPVIFFIGVVASLSSCMAVVGGLVLSMAATYAKESRKGKALSQIAFHAARIIGFFLLGGLLGWLGASFRLTPPIYFVLDLIIAGVMIILAFNMMDIFPFLKRFQPRMPKFLSNKALSLSEMDTSSSKIKYIITPVLIGAATFFLPCGFTQSMQLYALTTGNFFSGAMTMFVFALGTFPILALISFASISLSQSKEAGIFYKTAGIIVLFFAVINVLGALAIAGIISPILNF